MLVLSRTTQVSRSIIYAEDGREFLQDWLLNPSFFTPFRPYDGYLHFLPRVAAGLVSLLPASLWPIGCAVAACAGVAAVGALVWQTLRFTLLPVWCKLALVAIPCLLPIASVEPIGNLANLHWFLAYLIVFIATVRLTGRRSVIAWALIALVCALSEVQCAVVVPVMAYRLIRHREFRPVAIGWGIGMAAQVLAVLLSPRTQTGGIVINLTNSFKGYLINVVLSSVTSIPETIGEIMNSRGFTGLGIALLVYVALCLLAMVFGKGLRRWLVAFFLMLSGSAWLLTAAFGKLSDSIIYSVDNAPMLRWGTAASMYFLAAGALALGLAAKRFPRFNPVGIIVVVVTSLVWIPSLNSQVGHSGPTWEAELARAVESCAVNPAEVPLLGTAPESWSILVPCDRLR